MMQFMFVAEQKAATSQGNCSQSIETNKDTKAQDC